MDGKAVKKLTDRECRIMNTFVDAYDDLTDSHLVEGCTGISNPEELHVIIAGIAAVFTINKLLEEERHR